MQTLQAVIMGAVQGLTEFLPVSSSGHIVLSSAFYKLLTGATLDVVSEEEIFFDILIHLATLFAVIVYFYKDLKEIFTGFFKACKNKDYKNDNFKFVIFVMIGTFITAIFGLLIKDFAHSLTENPFIVSLLIMVTGSVLYISERFKGSKKDLNYKIAAIIGFFQGLAIFPGLSRSGMTISSAVFMGIDRVKAAKYSFILSIPVILLASLVYPLLTFDLKDVGAFNITAILIGMAVSFIVGYFCIKYFMKFLEKYGLKVFSFYCLTIGFISACIFYIN